MPGTGRTEERARTGTERVTALIGAAVTGLTGGGNGQYGLTHVRSGG
jgi:hypothetical protein